MLERSRPNSTFSETIFLLTSFEEKVDLFPLYNYLQNKFYFLCNFFEGTNVKVTEHFNLIRKEHNETTQNYQAGYQS